MRAMAFIGVLAVAGCANIDIQKVTSANQDTVHGIRYWRPAPYLSVTGDTNGTCVARLVYLPNMKEEYAITPIGGFGSINFKPTLTDGWNLTALDATVDSKTSVSDFLGAITKIQGLAIARSRTTPGMMTPGIYKLIFDNDGNVTFSSSGAFAGGTACLTISEPPPGK